jgi:predicted TIM-barrel fold metal-dependent hydrolase
MESPENVMGTQIASPQLSKSAVPFSSGQAAPRLKAPDLACDCHMHIYDSRIPAAPGATLLPADASVADYRLLQGRLRLTRTIVVTPSTYGTDNRPTLAALGKLGDASRGVAVVRPDVSDDELTRLDRLGVTGLRFNLSVGSVTTIDMIALLAKRIAPLGWHVQVALRADDLVAHEALFASLPVPVVLDHFAGVPATTRPRDAARQVLLRLLRGGNAWIKLSGAYLRSFTGAPDYEDLGDLARDVIETALHRVLWGSDWPHPTQSTKPDDARLLDLLLDWAPDDATCNAILVDNPATLYRF